MNLVICRRTSNRRLISSELILPEPLLQWRLYSPECSVCSLFISYDRGGRDSTAPTLDPATDSSPDPHPFIDRSTARDRDWLRPIQPPIHHHFIHSGFKSTAAGMVSARARTAVLIDAFSFLFSFVSFVFLFSFFVRPLHSAAVNVSRSIIRARPRRPLSTRSISASATCSAADNIYMAEETNVVYNKGLFFVEVVVVVVVVCVYKGVFFCRKARLYH